ncbi:CHAT domain-containing protein [Alkalinema pantanalense CENA528]|uniref:CHAT domain-containing protein n=1 Tax=Alkalinema pantanalense TaxID=1620705 RepID=UPI003D6DA8C6
MKSWTHYIAAILLGSCIMATPALALPPEQQVQEGITHYHSGQYSKAIQSWEIALRSYQQAQDSPRIAIVLENLARAYQQIGQGERELQHWNQLIELYRQQRNELQVGRSLTEKAQTLSRQGQIQTAIDILCGRNADFKQCAPNTALQLASKSGDRKTEAAALGSLGEAYRLKGDYSKAIPILEASLLLAKTENLTQYQAAAHNSLGNTYSNQALKHYRRSFSFQQQSETQSEQLFNEGKEFDYLALKHYEQSLKYQAPQGQLHVLTNLIPVYYRLQKIQMAEQTWQTAEQLRRTLPNSRTKAYATIDLATLLQSPPTSPNGLNSRSTCEAPRFHNSQAEALLKEGAQIAQAIQDTRAESYALGELGRLYECQGQIQQALAITRQAQLAAEQNLTARDSLYLWEWQIGRILRQQAQLNPSSEKIQQAIAAYRRAVQTLEAIRSDILTSNRDVQFDFRDTIDPIYRELVELELSQHPTPQKVAALPGSAIALDAPSALGSAIRTIDSLKLAELQNYFGNDCIIGFTRENINRVNDPSAAVINTIIFENKTAVILTLPSGKQQIHWILESQATLDRLINDYRTGLESYYDALTGYNPESAQQVYNGLIRAFETALEKEKIQTLIFVQDGIFRSVPMAALHDGQQFLIQKYNIAVAPSLSLVDPKPMELNNLRVLAMGVSKEAIVENTRFQPLQNVPQELGDLAKQVPASQYLNEQFRPEVLKMALIKEQYSILHFATHGKFGSDPEDTFLLTGDENTPKLNLNELGQLLATNKKPLDLLMLTACETAIGDNRSTLGLAGVAVQSGARSAIASLWQVNDSSVSQLTAAFYENLIKPNTSRAQALRAAQLQMLSSGGEFAHPYHWSALVLVGNWL